MHARERELRAVEHGLVRSVRVPATHLRDGRGGACNNALRSGKRSRSRRRHPRWFATYRPPPWSGRDGWHIVVLRRALGEAADTETNETLLFFVQRIAETVDAVVGSDDRDRLVARLGVPRRQDAVHDVRLRRVAVQVHAIERAVVVALAARAMARRSRSVSPRSRGAWTPAQRAPPRPRRSGGGNAPPSVSCASPRLRTRHPGRWRRRRPSVPSGPRRARRRARRPSLGSGDRARRPPRRERRPPRPHLATRPKASRDAGGATGGPALDRAGRSRRAPQSSAAGAPSAATKLLAGTF